MEHVKAFLIGLWTTLGWIPKVLGWVATTILVATLSPLCYAYVVGRMKQGKPVGEDPKELREILGLISVYWLILIMPMTVLSCYQEGIL